MSYLLPVRMSPDNYMYCGTCGEPLYESCCSACSGLACPDCGTGCDLDFPPYEGSICAQTIEDEKQRQNNDDGTEDYREPTDIQPGWQVQLPSGKWKGVVNALHIASPLSISLYTLADGQELSSYGMSEGVMSRRGGPES